ncbi:hypothetical protein Gotur_034337 [Gossypium turneri]
MRVGEQVREGLLDARSSYWHGFIAISGKWKKSLIGYSLNLQDEDIEWRAPWLIPDEILYRCRDFDWVPLLGIWGAIGYAPLLVSR